MRPCWESNPISMLPKQRSTSSSTGFTLSFFHLNTPTLKAYFLCLLPNNKTIWFDILESEFGKYLLIQKKKKIENEWVHEHSITIPLEYGEQFLKALNKVLNSKRMKTLLKKEGLS